MHRTSFVLIFLVLFAIPAVQGIEFRSGDDVVIDTEINDDLFVTGGRIVINAPVDSLTAAGGLITINAPVRGDVIAAGGDVQISGDVEGKVIGAGGLITVGGAIARNAVLTGGEVIITESGEIGRDAILSGGMVKNEGTVTGQIIVSADEFTNIGTAGDIQIKERKEKEDEGISFFNVVITIGFLATGLLIMRFLPLPFFEVIQRVKDDPVKGMLFGIGTILISMLILLLLGVTLVGLPLAAILGVILGIVILLSSLFVSAWLGMSIRDRFSLKLNDYGAFIVGFVLLHLIFIIPILGFLIRVLSIALGTGAVLIAVRENWNAIAGQPGNE